MPKKPIDELNRFFQTPLLKRLAQHGGGTLDDHVLALFRQTAQNVPAYAAFLKQHRLDPAAVTSLADFNRLPLMTKAGYMHPYDLADRSRDGTLATCEMWATSSGSTGTPMLWPRRLEDECRMAWRFEQVLGHFKADRHRTLAVICFPLGTWVGGMYTAQCCRLLAQKGFPISVVTPGNNKPSILQTVHELSGAYEQTVLLGYPPFLKDVLDTGISEGFDWQRYHIKMVFAGEVFTEEWRDLVNERAGNLPEEAPFTSAALYGTADGGVLGNETPLSISIRRFLSQHPDRARELFGESRLPTLVQYDPYDRYFELHENTVVISGDNGVPLIRYHIADQGGIIPFHDMMKQADLWQVDYPREAVVDLPFVYVFGRADFTVSFFGANVYPENISVALEQAPIHQWVTGKLVLKVAHAEDQNEILTLTVELLPGVTGDSGKIHTISEAVKQQLLRLNSEFANYVPPARQTPVVTLKPHGDPDDFPAGIKHRYTRK